MVYVRPQTVAQAVDLLHAPGVTSRVLTVDLVRDLRRGALVCDRVIDVAWLPELKTIAVPENGPIALGAAVTLTGILDHPVLGERVPLLIEACRAVTSVQLRNMTTLVTCADLVPVLVCLDAAAVILSPDGERLVPVADLDRRQPGGLLRAFVCDPPPDPARTAYLHVERRIGLAAAGALDAHGQIAEVRLVPGGVFDRPRRVSEVEAALVGQVPGEALFVEAGARMQAASEAAAGERWSVPYSGPVLAALTERVLRLIFTRRD